MSFHKTKQAILGLMAFSIALFLLPSLAHAFGPSKPTPPAYTLPNPLRYVIVRPFKGVAAIQTPNQVTTSMANVQQSLDQDLQTVVSDASTHLSYSNGNDLNQQDPCGTHLEIWPSVNAFEMDDMTINVQFGFNSTGTIVAGTPDATASDTISLGNITLAFGLYECDNSNTGNCSSLLSTSANQTVVGNNFQGKVTLGDLSAGVNILNNADLNNAITAIITNGISQMVGSSAMAQVPWETTVAAVNGNQVTFLAGAQSDIAENQYFTVYAQSSSSSECGVYQALACIYAQQVNDPSSVGVVYQTLDESTAIAPGDVVEVGSPSCAPN